MDNINKLTDVLLTESRKNAEKIIEDAKAEAERIISSAVKKAEEESQEIMQQYKMQSQAIEKQDGLQETMELKHTMLSIKQEIVDDVLDKVRSRCDDQNDEQWIDLILKRLKQESGANNGQKPNIIVPPRLAEISKQVFGSEYCVMVEELSNGFILSFDKYDLNYELERIFASQHEELEQLAVYYLFEDDTHERG